MSNTTVKSSTSTETKDISSEQDKMALTKKLTSLFGQVYVSTKKKLPLSDSIVKQLEQIESIVENKSTKIADLVDKKLIEQLESLESKKKEVREFVDKTLTEKLEKVVVPTATSILKKSDAVISYVLPPSASDDEDEEDEVNAASPLALAKDIVDKTSKRLRKRVASVTEKKDELIASVSEKKEEMIKKVDAKREEMVKYGLSLVAYAKSMSGKAGDIDLRAIADEVSKPYRKQAEKILVGVTDYGEYFMKSVREYEEAGAKNKTVSNVPEGKLNSMLAEVAHKFVEPCLVRTVAIFFVCGDEIKKVKTMHLEPQVDAMKKKLSSVRSDVVSAVAKKSEGLSAVLLAKKAELAALRTKLREMISKLTEEKLKEKFNEVIERVHFNETLVTLREKVDAVLKKYELKKYEDKVTEMVKKIHETIVEWVSPKKAAKVE